MLLHSVILVKIKKAQILNSHWTKNILNDSKEPMVYEIYYSEITGKQPFGLGGRGYVIVKIIFHDGKFGFGH